VFHTLVGANLTALGGGSLLVNSPYCHAKYLKSAYSLSDLPPDEGIEVACTGRSNAGKSSAINAVTGVRGLARTSKTPGRTRELIFFSVGPGRRLVDLPGYGYAKVPHRLRRHWHRTLDGYFRVRRSLSGLVLVMDSRHPLTDFDELMLNWSCDRQIPTHVLLTKADKLSRSRAFEVLRRVSSVLKEQQFPVSSQLFSATKRIGIEEAQANLSRLFDGLPVEENARIE
jgi:ribosome biogenesis GTP-binding protein YsxC/EngB